MSKFFPTKLHFLIMMLIFRFSRTKIPFDLDQQALHFGVLNYENQHKEGTCKVSGRSVVFSAFYADFCLCPKLVIITTLKQMFYYTCNANSRTKSFTSKTYYDNSEPVYLNLRPHPTTQSPPLPTLSVSNLV